MYGHSKRLRDVFSFRLQTSPKARELTSDVGGLADAVGLRVCNAMFCGNIARCTCALGAERSGELACRIMMRFRPLVAGGAPHRHD